MTSFEPARTGPHSAVGFDPCVESPVTRRFVEELPVPPFNTWIDASDEMFRYNLSSLKGSRPCAAILYYQIGWQILQTIRHVGRWRFGTLDRVSSLLDFASGHGRVTRLLVRELDPKRICVSEIHADALAFQHEQFGVETILSTSDPDAFLGEERFPFIVASSFFSHTPADSFQRWIAALLRRVDRDGVLMFSTLGSELLADEDREWSQGIVFLLESETDRLEKSRYGTAYVMESFVRDAIAHSSSTPWGVRRFPRGFCGLQDLYVVASPGGPSLEMLEPIDFARGDADVYALRSDGTLKIEGWSRMRPDGPAIRTVEFRVNQDPLERQEPRSIASGCFRWSFVVDSRQIAPDDVLMIRAVTSQNLASVVALGTVRTHPPAREK